MDVYGLRRTPDGRSVRVLHARDVLVGQGIPDERVGARDRPDAELVYDFLPGAPDELQPRLLITREIGSPEFARAFAALGARVRQVTPGRFGQDTTVLPFTVVPRDCALRLTFSHDLGIDATFFYTFENGAISGVRNTEAVQLLRIVGDPDDGDATGDFESIPARIIPAGNQLIVDPVLAAGEAVRLQVPPQPGGMPASTDQIAANVRLAIALEGPLAIPAIARAPGVQANGIDLGRRRSLVHDFRAGNARDDSAEVSAGFRRDPTPPRLSGDVLTYLERVVEIDAWTQRVTLFQRGARHRLDAGDFVRVVSPDPGAAPIALTEVVAEPEGDARADHVEVLVRREPALAAVDPARLPGYPADRIAREAWLVQHAPRAVLAVEFEDGDDARHFVRFTPMPLALDGVVPEPNRHVSPFAAAVVRFTKPIDLATARGLDTLFFATKPLAGAAGDAAIRAYLDASGMDPAAFDRAKFATPHLIAAQVFDENGGQTTLRVQPPLGFYLDDGMRRTADESLRTCWLHVVGGNDGILDLAGNALGAPPLVLDFTLDVRSDARGQPLFADNRVVSVARRFAAADEDENPSYHRRDEIQAIGTPPNDRAARFDDLFGAVHHAGGRLEARPTARTVRVADDRNQPPPPPQTSDLRWCPEASSGSSQVSVSTAQAKFGQPLQNPLNPEGCRLMTIWREVDLGLARVDPEDFDLDVEAMYWAPHDAWPVTFDEFDRMSLFLGHSEFRAENCEDAVSGLPVATHLSGLRSRFADNFVRDRDVDGRVEPTGPRNPAPHVAFRDRYLVVDPASAVTEPHGINQYLPLPPLERPHFVWRDQTVDAQGGAAGLSSDIAGAARTWEPYLLSPFLGGGGRFYMRDASGLRANWGRWINAKNHQRNTPGVADELTGGLVGATALPLLADFHVFPDGADLPAGRGYVAAGRTGWQIALAVESSAAPNFRVYSAGGNVRGERMLVEPGTQVWNDAAGGFNPVNGQRTPGGDNSFFWVRCDFLKRQSVATAGFVDLLDPHRVDADLAGRDPRLGPYYPARAGDVLPRGVVPVFHALFEPPLHRMPADTEVVAQYRGAGIVDPQPWIARDARFQYWQDSGQIPPDHVNFPLDPRKAGDAGIRKFSDRLDSANRPRNFWVHHYNVHVTDYVDDPNTLTDPRFLARFAAPDERLEPSDLRYCNWRFILRNDPVSRRAPGLDSFALVYRFAN